MQMRMLKRFTSLKELQQDETGKLDGLVLLSRGRLSVQHVSSEHWSYILEYQKRPA